MFYTQHKQHRPHKQQQQQQQQQQSSSLQYHTCTLTVPIRTKMNIENNYSTHSSKYKNNTIITTTTTAMEAVYNNRGQWSKYTSTWLKSPPIARYKNSEINVINISILCSTLTLVYIVFTKTSSLYSNRFVWTRFRKLFLDCTVI